MRMQLPRSLAPLLAASLLASACSSTDSAPDSYQHAEQLARSTLILDGHIDVPIRLRGQSRNGQMDDISERTQGGDFDYPRAVRGGLDAPFFSIYTPATAEDEGNAKEFADGLIDLVEGVASAHPDKFQIATTVAEVRATARGGRVALLLGMENGSPVEGDLANLDHFYERGIRYITLCHSKDNHICDSSYDERHTHAGLTPFGREIVARMNDLGMMIDVSHISDDSFWQVLALSRTPVIASHSSLRHFVPDFERNLSDAMVERLAENGGVVQINFGSTFLREDSNKHRGNRRDAIQAFLDESGAERDSRLATEFVDDWDRENPFPFADVSDVVNHIDRVVELVGVEHVGFGSDFDGVGATLPTRLKDVSHYPNLISELLRRGYSEGDIEKICSGNVLRVMSEVEAAATR